jgi:hypothetical protein
VDTKEHLELVCNILATQRNQALDECARLAAQIVVLEKKIKTLETSTNFSDNQQA